MPKETHPNWCHDVPGMRPLILGTFPPHNSRWDYCFYYPNSQNPFWEALALCRRRRKRLSHFQGCEAVAERRALMRELHVGVQNVGRIVQRAGKSAADEDIRILRHQNIRKILSSHPTLRTIHLTGFSGKTNCYNDFLKAMGITEERRRSLGLPKRAKINFRFRLPSYPHILCIVGNSTSPRARKSAAALARQFRKALFQRESL